MKKSTILTVSILGITLFMNPGEKIHAALMIAWDFTESNNVIPNGTPSMGL